MTRALQTIPQEPEDSSAEIYLTGAYFLLPFGSVLLLGLVALRVPGAQILAVGWYIFFLSFGPALFAVWCLYTCGAYDADALSVRGGTIRAATFFASAGRPRTGSWTTTLMWR